ncbi:hypothetical protein Q0Z83_041640 [Actinoplanes sichuanensis]|uniref:SHOCT domain-containing protein n=1 Tax=Actinoplanes sichuanensis TaxID=512349 RepID=A0ABW4ALF0_9ACTN|nr:hypothetical protein Q0Z83_041640 [Actinoplanes sichuanensis]
MATLIILVVLLIITITVVFWRTPDATPSDEAAGAGDDGVSRETAPTTLEGALVTQLLQGGISRAQYQQALSRLAARDDERNPMSVPGSDRPDAAA